MAGHREECGILLGHGIEAVNLPGVPELTLYICSIRSGMFHGTCEPSLLSVKGISSRTAEPSEASRTPSFGTQVAAKSQNTNANPPAANINSG